MMQARLWVNIRKKVCNTPIISGCVLLLFSITLSSSVYADNIGGGAIGIDTFIERIIFFSIFSIPLIIWSFSIRRPLGCITLFAAIFLPFILFSINISIEYHLDKIKEDEYKQQARKLVDILNELPPKLNCTQDQSQSLPKNEIALIDRFYKNNNSIYFGYNNSEIIQDADALIKAATLGNANAQYILGKSTKEEHGSRDGLLDNIHLSFFACAALQHQAESMKELETHYSYIKQDWRREDRANAIKNLVNDIRCTPDKNSNHSNKTLITQLMSIMKTTDTSYWESTITESDFTTLLDSAKMGDADVQYILAKLYKHLKSYTDDKVAMTLYACAAEQQHPSSMLSITSELEGKDKNEGVMLKVYGLYFACAELGDSACLNSLASK